LTKHANQNARAAARLYVQSQKLPFQKLASHDTFAAWLVPTLMPSGVEGLLKNCLQLCFSFRPFLKEGFLDNLTMGTEANIERAGMVRY